MPVCAVAVLALPARALALPDGRGYEMVTPLDKNAQEVGAAITGTDPGAGNAVNWEALGGCCGATSAASTLYQSTRTSSGWVTTPKTPTPPTPLVGLFEEQQPMWWSPDLSKTVYLTPSSYTANDARPPGPGATVFFDLYEQDASSALTWLTGPFPGAKDTNQYNATWAATTPDGNSTLFDSQDQLTSDATTLKSLNTPAEYLYDTNIASGTPTTSLVNVTSTTLTSAVAANATALPVASTSLFTVGQTITVGLGPDHETATISGIPSSTEIDVSPGVTGAHASGETVDQLISTDGAIAGNGNFLNEPSIPANDLGTTTNSISNDGTKVFFESPGTCVGGSCGSEGVGSPHLYMRDLSTNTTTPIDNPSSSGQAVYEGASTDGSQVFFTSDEGLGGDTNTDNELYDFHDTTLTAPANAVNTITVGGVRGFVPGEPLTIDAGTAQETATIRSIAPDASTDTSTITLTSFLSFNHAAGAAVDGVTPLSDGNSGTSDGNVVGVTAISNDGSEVWFAAQGVLSNNGDARGDKATDGFSNFYVANTATGATTFIGNLGSPVTTLSANASAGDTSITVADARGFVAGEQVKIDTAASGVAEQDSVASVPDSTHITLSTALANNHSSGAPVSVTPTDSRDKTALTGEPDINRGAIPTPDGGALVFESTADLTGQNPAGLEGPGTASLPTPTLSAGTASNTSGQPVSVPVTNTQGFVVGRTVEIESGFFSESGTIVGIPDSTHLSVTDGFGLIFPHSTGDAVVQRPAFEIYRYVTASNSLTCISCGSTTGVLSGSAGLGASGGGSYGPQGQGVPMSSDGSRIFFNSPDPLAPGVISSPAIPIGLFGGLTFAQHVYEWENGTVSAISDGHSTTGSALGTTTPSGNDVFFTTEDQLVSQDTDGYDDIYDARVGGGFPAPPAPTPPCGSAEVCRPSAAPTVFFPTPSSATLIEPTGVSPAFSVNPISAKQRKRFAATGLLTLTVHVTQAGKIAAVASDPGKNVRLTVASASHLFFATHGGTARLTLRLSKAARKKLAKQHRLSVVITISYSESGEVYIASLTLTKAGAKPAGDRRSSNRRQTRER